MGGLAAMLISLQSTMECITKTKRKPALIFDGSRFTLNRRMDNRVCYVATGDVQKGPVLVEQPLKEMVSNKLHHTIMLWM